MQPMRNPEDEIKEIAKLAYENWEDNYVKEVYCDVTLALYVFDLAQYGERGEAEEEKQGQWLTHAQHLGAAL